MPYLLFVVGLLNLLIGSVVFIRDYRKLQNRLFLLLSIALSGWTIGIGGFLITRDSEAAFLWAKAYYFFPLLVAASMPLFSMAFPHNEKPSVLYWMPIVSGFVFLSSLLLLERSFVTAGLVYHNWGKEIVLNKVDYLLYSVYLLACFGTGLVHTYFKSLRAKGLARAQLRFYFFGFLITSFFGVYFNLILPWFGNYRLIWLGPLFTNFFIMAIAYSIVKHQLFDVRLVVARSVAYLASLLMMASMYAFVVFGIAQYVFDLRFSVVLQVALSAATGIAAIAFQGVKRFFDKATNQLFYRDAYDSQVLFNEFNNAIVSTIDLNALLQRSSQTIVEHFKVEFCEISILKDNSDEYEIVGTRKKHYNFKDVTQIRDLMRRFDKNVIITDNLTDDDKNLNAILINNDIAVLVKLTLGAHSDKESSGYIAFGRKKSGSLYAHQDTIVIESLVNELNIALQNALRFEEIERFNETLQEKIDVATHKLKLSNHKLVVLNETKDDFIGMASHQLRTPLTSVKGYLSLVIDGDAGKVNEMQKKLLTQAFVSSERMVYMIADLLNVSRLRTGKFMVERTPTNLATIITDELEQLREVAASRGVKVVFAAPADFPLLPLDETKTRQVIMNFMDNAIYYTPSGGNVRVELHETRKSVELRVIDDGIGVPKQELHHLFTKFYRAKNAQRARPDGTGLGLFMAKKVIVAQGGAIIFNSKEGKGSTFGFNFPKDMPEGQVAMNSEI